MAVRPDDHVDPRGVAGVVSIVHRTRLVVGFVHRVEGDGQVSESFVVRSFTQRCEQRCLGVEKLLRRESRRSRLPGATPRPSCSKKASAIAAATFGREPPQRRTSCTLADGAPEQSAGLGACGQRLRVVRSGRHPENRDVVRVTAESCDVVADPTQRGDLIRDAVVPRSTIRPGRRLLCAGNRARRAGS